RSLLASSLQNMPDAGFLAALQADRSLYQHQEQAISKVLDGRNVVVATGTGSGKTECFLYPILLHLYNEFLNKSLGPGARALILYPMNALANDQRERLGKICKKLKDVGSPFQFTFGRYIGETPENENDSYRNALEHLNNRLEGELVLRSEMRETPPHILLTNYSMLEYLLLRPYDSALFDNGRANAWRFIVLDEAHQYRGANGIEMAMLIRRLKQRLREGGRFEPFTCIATSASLTGGKDDTQFVADFASKLFGESFDSNDTILGETIPITKLREQSLSPDDYTMFHDIIVNDAPGPEKLAKAAERL
ncbi:DEAD/DEAH box helicase, partial [candidate division KSB1 bacterium]|nr:DEAD/DEAH box helicase [candidate division KSB1 bacterium]NIR73024.1 DEAD/DEAH box helicase [candidate division KSB1 bacterium]NIS25195.1 DEAD/DEAH box helicase [candidate division KSB1 bacterium]NIU25903.1 DEAD/DEAH box helicase [candidate division KSB1 bacterium]NIV97051.1 DEAD/DEAH box helicase [candidate division KSB1 bacterium]